MELEVVKHIKKYGLQETVDKFKLIKKDFGSVFLLKYSQLDSPMYEPIVRECRGLILYQDYTVASYAFNKFFNYGEYYADKLDKETTTFFDKCDGSMIQVYYNKVSCQWEVGTTGTADGSGKVNSIYNLSENTFRTLFINTLCKQNNWNLSTLNEIVNTKLIKGYTYIFELMTPENIVIVPHQDYSTRLLAVRRVWDNTYIELNFNELQTVSNDIQVPLPNIYWYGNEMQLNELKNTFSDYSHTFEGYVACDKDNNRVKIKNPKYLSAHYLKGGSKKHHILNVIKDNEIDEFICSFPEVETFLLEMKDNYLFLPKLLLDKWNYYSTFTTVKELADHINNNFKKHNLLTAYFFKKYRDNNLNAKQYIDEIPTKKLYEFLCNFKREDYT